MHFYDRHRKRHKSSTRPMSPAMLKLFERHTWPSNIRELENLMERYVILGRKMPSVRNLRIGNAPRSRRKCPSAARST